MITDTIFALASGQGRTGVAVWRLSGPLAAEAVRRLTTGSLPPPRQACRAWLRDPVDGERIDDGLVLWFPAPRSFTGEDVAELQTHGGRAVASAVVQALLALGLRPAEAGEFSRRAFLNGKLDLTRAEAIADLVEAETAAQRRQALRQMDGALNRQVEAWRAELVHILAYLEATIDFADEDLPDDLAAEAAGRVATLAASIRGHLDDGQRGERLRDGVHLAIIGAPNAGKSSLLNRLAGREVAIVSATAGTTRDVIELHLDLGGWPVVVADTAGLREAEEEIEAEGIRRAHARAHHADLKLAVFDASDLPTLDPHTLALVDDATLVVLNKADLSQPVAPLTIAGQDPLVISARTGAGIDALLSCLTTVVGERYGGVAAPLVTRSRHRHALEHCVQALDRVRADAEIELAAEDMRAAAAALGRITGRVDVEELLDVVFSTFCIGK